MKANNFGVGGEKKVFPHTSSSLYQRMSTTRSSMVGGMTLHGSATCNERKYTESVHRIDLDAQAALGSNTISLGLI